MSVNLGDLVKNSDSGGNSHRDRKERKGMHDDGRGVPNPNWIFVIFATPCENSDLRGNLLRDRRTQRNGRRRKGVPNPNWTFVIFATSV